MSNPYRLIKQFVLLTGLGMVAIAARAQQSYYICIQSENGQPFYTQIGDKVYSSSAVGHLIISGLKDNVCNLEIGFPQHTSRPQQFSVPIRGKDQGYQLKKSGSQHWTLVSWQGQETIKPETGSGSNDLLYGERKKDDAFAALMAAVVNDSAVLYTSIVKNDAPITPSVTKTEEKKPEAVVSVANKDEKALVDTSTAVAGAYENDKPLYDTTTAVKKTYVNEKPLFDTAMAKTAPPPVEVDAAVIVAKEDDDQPLFDTAALAKLPKNNTSIIDITTGKPLYDTAAVEELEEEPAARVNNQVVAAPVTTEDKAVVNKEEIPAAVAAKKADKPGVIKVQQTKKDGETKIVFIDSSESPADVVTVYITDEPLQSKKPAQLVSAGLNEVAPNTGPEQKTVAEKTTDSVGKTDTVLKKEPAAPAGAQKEETVRKTETEPAEAKQVETAPKAEPAEAREEQAKPAHSTETTMVREVHPVIEKPAGKKGDTLVVILESPQQKRDTAKTMRQEAPKPMHAPPETTVAGAEKTATDVVADQPAVAQETDKTTGETGKRGKAAKNDDNTAVPATDQKAVSKPVVQQEVTAHAGQPAVKDDTAAHNMEAGPSRADAAQKPKAVYDPKPAELDKKVVMINSDCDRFATENDVDKLRVKMLNEKDVNKRVAVAYKVFKSMCLTAKQIKALTELFPTDENKYKFLETAYPFAADTSNFKELYEVFSTETYQTKFKAMVRY